MDKQVKLGIVVSILILLGIAGYVWYDQNHEDGKFVNEIQRNLVAEDRKIFEDRIIDYKSKLSQTNDDAEKYNLYLQIGFTEYALGHLQVSKDSFLEAIEINTEQYDVYQGLFQTQIDMEDFEGAEASIKKSISIRKGIADLWRRYIQFKIDKINASNEEIIKLFDEAVNDILTNGDAVNLTDIYTFYAPWLEKSGNLQSAIDYWKKAIGSNPDSKVIYQSEIDRIQKMIN